MARVYVSIGSNVDREPNIRASQAALHQRYQNIDYSSVYESAAVGFEGASFYNLVVGFDTYDSPRKLIEDLKHIEDEHGRDRSQPKFSDRSLDLDLLLYGQRVDEKLGIPRDEILKHAHVLAPLAELIPDQEHPGSAKSYRVLWDEFEDDSQALWIVDFQPGDGNAE